ncbi:hypothetical protein P154DRAFT_111674 [Amniculicola lignicola CBS 123094]|uniref:Zn(2)-C6 fungal-type domain-containing protein n=1 Tax=Amniculicola lignicola CBS 123094 TaxID=1392246 RepID=A0A6A5WVN4_9PLEO|nr:hypothetical protein P154DRAFT_111674 [Amniculicola lignicola CBS 123094]
MPKRSSGCFSCRARKVRCDETKPECNNCVRRGTRCLGYRPAQSFVIHTFDRHTEKPSIIKEDDERYKRTESLQGEASNKENTDHQHCTSKTKRSIGAVLSEPAVPAQVSPVAIERVQYLGTFLSQFLPSLQGNTLTPPAALMVALPTTPATRRVFLSALDALAAAQLAVSNRNHQLINRCRSLYGTALSQMVTSITQPGAAEEDEILLATHLLTLYEVFVGVADGQGFFYHFQGVLRILKQRGPASIQSKLSMGLLHGIRYHSLSIGFTLRKAQMLAAPEWIKVTSQEAQLDPWVAIMDACIQIPGILERTEKAFRTGSSPPELEQILADSQRYASAARAQLAIFEKNGPQYSIVSIDTIPDFLTISNDRTYDPVFRFHSFAASTTYLLFWMGMLVLQSNALFVRQKLVLPLPLSPAEFTQWDEELSAYADSICRGVPYNAQRTSGYTGRFSTLTPLMIARRYFEARGMGNEVRWCEKAYYGTRVDGLYTPPLPIKPIKVLVEAARDSEKFI